MALKNENGTDSPLQCSVQVDLKASLRYSFYNPISKSSVIDLPS